MTILELIQAQCRAVGVSEKYAEKIQKLFKIEKEEGIGTFVQMFKDNIMADVQLGEQANQTAIQTAVQAAISEYEKKHSLKDGKPVETPKPVDTTGLSPEVKAVLDGQQKTLDTLTQLVTGMAKSQQTSQIRESAKALFKGKIDDEFVDEHLDRIDFNAENFDLNAAVEAQVKSFTAMKQKFIGKAIENGDFVPAQGSAASDTDIDSYIKAKAEKQDSGFDTIEL